MGKPVKEQKKKYRGKVEFLGVNYPTVESLKAVFKALIVKTKNDAIIEEPGKSQVKIVNRSCSNYLSTMNMQSRS
jgi:hypothetical protein